MGLLSGRQLIVVDTETTGFSPEGGHALLEVATVAIDEGAIGETWSSLVQPGRAIPADATAIHGITEAMVAEAATTAGVAAELRRRCADRMLVFHNAPFDLPFLAVMMRTSGQPPFGNPVVDTLGLARRLTGAGGNSLDELAVKFELPPQPRHHRALDDAMTTARLFLALVREWEQKPPVRSLLELAADSQDALRPAPAR